MFADSEDIGKRASVVRNHSTRLNRSDTVRSSSGEQHDWAFNRSPLQKLEVALSGISKEEKRARALEAERKLKERTATAAAKPVGSPAHEAHARSTIRTHSQRMVDSRDAPIPTRREPKKEPKLQLTGDDEKQGDTAPEPEPNFEKVTTSRTNEPPANDPDSRTLVESQKADNKPPVKLVVRGGVVPRRAVSISHQAQEPRMSPRASSQAPSRSSHALFAQAPLSPATPQTSRSPKNSSAVEPISRTTTQPVATATRGTTGSEIASQQTRRNGHHDNPPAAGALNLTANSDFQNSGESMVPSSSENVQRLQTKSKRNTVSFDVPPPTPPPLFEWKAAPIARLEISDFDFQTLDVNKSKAWWEGGGTQDRRQSRALPKDYQKPPAQKLACKLIL
jgi:hypothetical protein